MVTAKHKSSMRFLGIDLCDLPGHMSGVLEGGSQEYTTLDDSEEVRHGDIFLEGYTLLLFLTFHSDI